MNSKSICYVAAVVVALLWLQPSCKRTNPENSAKPAVNGLRGCSGYTPYDSFSMLWARGGEDRKMVWVSSGGEAGRLLVSKADPSKRPDWALCTQGVVAGLAARGEDVVIIGTTFISDEAIVPVFRLPRKNLSGARSLFIPRSSIEFAFDHLLAREGVSRESVSLPKVEKLDFSTVVSLLGKPATDADSLDFAILVDPFVSNMLKDHPGQYEVGKGGLYEMHYCIVARREDVSAKRDQFVNLLKQFAAIGKTLDVIKTDEEFRQTVWGREKGGQPERLPEMVTFSRKPLHLQMNVTALRERLREEHSYLTKKYPGELQMPQDIDRLVDPSLLLEAAPEGVAK